MSYGTAAAVKVGLISAILNNLTNGPREIKFDLLFDRKKDLHKSGNIDIIMVAVNVNIMTAYISTDFFMLFETCFSCSFSKLPSLL